MCKPVVAAAILAMMLLPGCSEEDSKWPIHVKEVVSGLQQPLFAAHAGDGSGRLFLVEREGRVLIHDHSGLHPEPFINLTASVGSQHVEQGLLGLAFHPAFPENGWVYLSYTDPAGNFTVARFGIDPSDPDRLDPSSKSVVIQVEQPGTTHNGGHIEFGPDGFLYIGLGDGQWHNEYQAIQDDAQNRSNLLGSILRLDVDGEIPYGIPPDNPFVGKDGRGEIWAYGLRNPWRFSFDAHTGDLYIPDVGQTAREEINLQSAGDPGGQNYGWPAWEGPIRIRETLPADQVTFPVAHYRFESTCAVTGGYVYHGEAIPDLTDRYVFGDLCGGFIFSLDLEKGQIIPVYQQADLTVSSLGMGEDGEIYILNYGGGNVFELVAS